ncbi:MAG TPA: non-homologous end-joining DNA ligase [Candidatus Acidoferrales bacterium]|nr:non-homologous end-joining DNA ligase [Candidatus Acidoferrales bacterium]
MTKPRAMKKSPAHAAAGKLAAPISHPDKIFWPAEGYTKADLAAFYQSIFPKLRPYLADRILSMERCPGGMRGACFYQKESPKGMPASTPTKRIRNSGGRRAWTNYVVGGSLETQIALVNLGCIAVHAAAGRADSPRQPDWVCFDLDPDSGKFADAARAGRMVGEALDSLGLSSYPKTSGSRGLHIFVPIRRSPDASDVLKFAQEFVKRLAAAHPKELTVEHSIAARRGRVYLDPFRNGFGQTVVTPYSVRRREKAPVSTPLAWAELTPGLDPAEFNIGNFVRRAARKDPWSDFFRKRQSLAAAIRKVSSLE